MWASPDSRMGIELILLPRELSSAHALAGYGKFGFTEPGVALDAFQNESNSLAHADAHGAERVSTVSPQKLVERGGYKPRAAGTQGVSEGNRATVRIYVRRVVWNSQFAQHRQRLRSECFIQFHDIHLSERQSCFGENFSSCGNRTHAHDSRSDASGCGGDD